MFSEQINVGQQQAEEALCKIAQGISTAANEAFFSSLVQNLAQVLDVSYAFIGELAEAKQFSSKHQDIKTIALWACGRIADNFEYHPEPPCAQVVRSGLLQCYPNRIQQQFPGNPWLRDWDLESYIGTPLIDATGRVLGLMAVMDTKPLRNRQLAESMLKIFAVRASAELERKQAEEQLRQREAQLRQALEAARLGFWTWDIQTGQITGSPNLQQIYGWSSDMAQWTYEFFLEVVHPEDREYLHNTHQCTLATGKEYRSEFRIIWTDGTIRWIESKGHAIYDHLDHSIQLTGIDLDISDRKFAETKIQQSLQEKEILLQEIHHRVKNNLQVVSSLLDLQSQYTQEPAMREMFRESHNRIRSMALVHEKLYQSHDLARIDFAEYIESLTHHLFQTYGVDANTIELELDVAPVYLNIDTAIPCGLIIGELISNALKHGLLNKAESKLCITFQTELDNCFILSVKDNGQGFSDNFDLENVKTLGLQLVKILTSQLQGTLDVNRRDDTEIRISFSEISG